MYDINAIPIGAENAISREALRQRWGGIGDRDMRRIVADLRTVDNGDNLIIISLSNGRGGYYRTDNPVEIRHYINETEKRARNTRRSLNVAYLALSRLKEAEA